MLSLENELLRWLDIVADMLDADPGLPADRLARELALTFDVPTVQVVRRRGAGGPWRVLLTGFGLEGDCPRLRTDESQLAFVARPARPTATADERLLAARLVRVLPGVLRGTAERPEPPWGPSPAVTSYAGEERLTAREAGVLRLLYAGLTAARIGRRLGISERTVHKHLESVYRKLGVSDRLSAVAEAQRRGLLAVVDGVDVTPQPV